MKQVAAVIERPKWDAVILICKQCRKRGNGPKDLKSKALGKIAKSSVRALVPRPRIVYTSCMGLCPKEAAAIAFIGRGGPPRVVAIETTGQFDVVLPQLIGADPSLRQ